MQTPTIKSLPIDVLHIIADKLPIRHVARLMSVDKFMYARRETVMCRALMRTRPMSIKAPAITAASKTSAKIAFVKVATKKMLPEIRAAVLRVLASGQTATTPDFRPRVRAKTYELCKKLGLKAEKDYDLSRASKVRWHKTGGCECCGDTIAREEWCRMTISV